MDDFKEVNVKKNILIIKDIRNWFWATFPNWEKAISLDVEKIKKNLENNGFNVEITTYVDIDLNLNFKEYYVLYGSYEDYCSSTKEYFEDIILFLQSKGATLIPKFEYFRAHDNKVMMEILRNDFRNSKLKTTNTRIFPSLEFLDVEEFDFPVVIKTSKGSGGSGVALARNKIELYMHAKKFSKLIDEKKYIYLSLVNLKQKILGRKPVLINNSKFIVQNFIPNLSGDFKVLIFGNHYFVLYRLNRENDFRASGSGRFGNLQHDKIIELLEFARDCKMEIESPFVSVDIGYDGKEHHLIEFQCITFGFKTMSMSEYHYVYDGNSFTKENGKVISENEFCYAVCKYINVMV